MRIILKNGHVLENVELRDSGKSAIGLWRWSMKQKEEHVLGFKGISILASEIAAIEEEEENITPYNYMDSANNNN